MGYTVAVVGATGAVGAQMIKMLEESSLPIDKVRFLASARSAGKILQFKGQDIVIEETTETAFDGVDIALFSAGGSTSAKYAPYAVKSGAVVVDNTSYFRQDSKTPLVVPEVNAHALDHHNGIISCPNCSTIQMMLPLKAIADKCVITGGLSGNEYFAELLSKKLGRTVTPLPDGRYAGAYGAAILAGKIEK